MIDDSLSFSLMLKGQRIAQLNNGVVHIWMADLNDFTSDFSELERQLSESELNKADRFVRAADRRRYVFAHGLLRFVLAHYLGVDPRNLIFNGKDGSKPTIALSSDSSLEFNLSHSRDRVLIGVSLGQPLGVDIEFIRSGIDVESLGSRVCTQAENDLLINMKGQEQLDAFYSCWTLKEAFIKAIGKGLSFPLDQLEVDFTCGSSFSIKNYKIDGVGVSSWFFCPFEAGANYKSAACVAEGIDHFICYQCRDLRVFDSFCLP